MKSEVKEYVASCHICQEAKSSTLQQIGELKTYPPLERKWEVIPMDLPRISDQKTAILVVVDKLSKRTHFIALEDNHTAKDTAEYFYSEIYKHHGLPRTIVSDRDTRFTGTFWRERELSPKCYNKTVERHLWNAP